MRHFRLLTIRLHSGSWYPVLIDSRTALPHGLAAEWVRAMLESGAQEISAGRFAKRRYRLGTVIAFLHDLILFLDWLESQEIDLAERFRKFESLKKGEVRRIVNFLSHRRHRSSRVVTPISYSPSTINRRILAARSFSSFCFQKFIDLADADKQIPGELLLKAQERRFSRTLFPKTSVRIASKPYATADDETAQLLVDVLHPASEVNPYNSPRLKLRNYCLLLVILETGARTSEVSLLETTDVDERLHQIRIKYPSKQAKGARRDGANLKTQARTIGISPELHAMLGFYIAGPRDDLLNGVPSNALFPNARDGKRLSTYGVRNVLKAASQISLPTATIPKLHVHMFRKRAAAVLRRGIDRAYADASPLIRAGAMQDMMTYQFGWSSDSEMPKHYSRKELIRRLIEIMRETNIQMGLSS